jgi:hypothetical protein
VGGEEGPEVEVLVEEAFREFSERVLPKLQLVAEETRRFLYFIAWLNSFVESRGLGRVVVTGGFAVEVYTARVYRTMDVDVVAEGRAAEFLERFLGRFSERIGRGFLPSYEVLSLKSVDVVSSVYTRGREPTVLEVDGLRVYLDPVEDLVATYLAGWKFWGSTEDRDKALWLLATWLDRLDRGYLEELCREYRVEDKLGELLAVLTNLFKPRPGLA